eukprot:g14984.t1
MDQGGDALIMNHYHKVKKELQLQLERHKVKTIDEQVSWSRLSTCGSGTDFSSPSPTESGKESDPVAPEPEQIADLITP